MMRIGCVLVAAALTACGGDEPTKAVVGHDAGADASKAQYERDAGHRDAGHDSGKSTAEGGSNEPEGGSGGMPVSAGGAGGMAAGGSGGNPPNPPPEGGAGAGGQGGSVAPQERVLWSQEWTVAVHEAVAYGAAEGDLMGLILDAGQGCRFGQMGAPSGSTQTYETNGACITAFSAPAGAAAFFSISGQTNGSAGRADLVGWKDAVQGHTVKYLRRSQTYTIQLLGSDSQTWNYADFTGKWEAVGY